MKHGFCCFLILLAAIPVGAEISNQKDKAQPNAEQKYDLTIPENWKQSMLFGKLTVDHNAFYGVPWAFGLYPVVHLKLPVENLTSEVLHFKVNFRTESKQKGYGNSGMGVLYTMGPGEKRLINTIAPIASVTRPIRFILRMSEPIHNPAPRISAETKVVIIDPFKVSSAGSKDVEFRNARNDFFEIKRVRLVYSKDQGNVIEFDVQNKADSDLPLEAYVAVNDPDNIENRSALARSRGFFYDAVESIPAKNIIRITIPYDIPPVGPKPVLVYTLFKPNQEIEPGGRDVRKWDMMLVDYGSLDLIRATESSQCVIPVHLPVQERAKLTAQKESEHFLFKYRPGSYAEKNIENIVAEREEAYSELSSVLQMELPVKVTIDLYPDMEAKALGSGTTWTPANTRSNKHICELYNPQYQCDPFHELAHIFSYHFPNYGSNQGGIVEAFAAYFEPDNMRVGPTKNILKSQLSEGKLPALTDVLHSESSSQELVILIDFLLKKDVEKFKQFYVLITKSQKPEIEKAIRQIYGMDVKSLEKQWHEFINSK